MQIPSAITPISIDKRLLPWCLGAALLCVWLCGEAQAADPLTQSVSGYESPMFSVITLKDRLVWLRDITVSPFMPKSSPTHGGEPNGAGASARRFDTERALFKVIGTQAYRNSMDQLLKQQYGLQLATNVHFQYEVNHYRTAKAEQEVGVRLGLRYGFR